MALAILIMLQYLAEDEIDKVRNQYKANEEDQVVLTELEKSGYKVFSACILDIGLAMLLVLNFVINCCLVGKPLKESKIKSIYGSNRQNGVVYKRVEHE